MSLSTAAGSYLDQLPEPAPKRIALHVTPAGERALRAHHPWLFADSIIRQSREGAPGDLAVAFDSRRRFLAIGLYDPGSPIRLRVLQQGKPAFIDKAWFFERLAAATARRASLAADEDTTAYRLVHGENDGLPGLVVDRYAGTLVLKLYTAAWLPHLRHVLPALEALVAPERVVLRLSRHLRQQPQHLYGLKGGDVLSGPPLAGAVEFLENGLRFTADVVAGHKTGFFLDQRDNRARVEALAAGANVLNVFAYTGGFSLYAARGGATRVTSLDLSEPALAAAVHHFVLNADIPAVAATKHEPLPGDAFERLGELAAAGRRYDLVILDPPSFASSQDAVPRALNAYARLARLGLDVLRPDGMLIAASCSSRVPADDFFATIHEAARAAGRPLREVERTFHPLDHPVTFAEGAYLKCLFAQA